MFSSLVSSFKGYMGWDNLEVTAGGNNEEKAQQQNIEERQSLFKQLSGFIGKDITSMISLPVWVFEPFSFLEVMAEPLQFDELLIKASTAPDSRHRIAYLSAFIIAGYSCAVRNKKPFNPLLGETFEYIAAENRWKFFAEQVSHHPPIGVCIITSDKFTVELEMELKTKFTGNSSDVIVLGKCSMKTTEFNDHFTWNHLDTTAHNVIVGGMWVDHYGTLEVNNHTTGDKCVLRVTKSGWLGVGRFEVNGEVVDKEGVVRLKMGGKWNEVITATKVNPDGTPAADPIALWKRAPAPASKWNWTKWNDDLNALTPELEATLPPTDSRLRTDRRALEKDDVNTAGKEKHRLEEEQRAKRKAREASGEHYAPKYFKRIDHEDGTHTYENAGGYWEDREKRVAESQAKKSAETSETEKPVEEATEKLGNLSM